MAARGGKKRTAKKQLAKKTMAKKKVAKRKSAAPPLKKTVKPAGKKAAPRAARKEEPQREVYQLYQKALSLVHGKEYKDAQKVLLGIRDQFRDEIDVLDRVNTFLSICETRLTKKKQTRLSQPEEFFDEGVVYHNWGQHEKALEYFSTALKQGDRKNSDHIHYAIAAAEVHLGNHERALESLKEAIELREDNRFIARNDPDFGPLVTNERFRELIRYSKK